MAAFPTTKTKWTYISDSKESLPMKAMTGYTDQASTVGGSAWSGGPHMPKRYGLKPRCAIAKTAGGIVRRVTIYDSTAYDALTVDSSTVDVNVNGTGTVATVVSKEGERHRGGGLNY
jgi:hypothetical protein